MGQVLGVVRVDAGGLLLPAESRSSACLTYGTQKFLSESMDYVHPTALYIFDMAGQLTWPPDIHHYTSRGTERKTHLYMYSVA